MKINKQDDGKRTIEIDFKQLFYIIPLIGVAGAGGTEAIEYSGLFGRDRSDEIRIQQIAELKERVEKLESKVEVLTTQLIDCVGQTDYSINEELMHELNIVLN